MLIHRLIYQNQAYENLEVVGISRLGVGATTDTGANLLLNVGVSAATTSVGIGLLYSELRTLRYLDQDIHLRKVINLNQWVLSLLHIYPHPYKNLS